VLRQPRRRAANPRRIGGNPPNGDPDAILKDLKATLAKRNSANGRRIDLRRGVAEAERVTSKLMDRFIDSIEWIAAIFVGVVAFDVFISIMLRYFFSVQIPDSYNFGQLLLGILIFWGIAATSYRGTHITVDLLYANVSPLWQRVMDVFATLVLLFVVAVQTWTLFDKVVTTRADNVQTFDLRLPVWPFYAVAWIGDVAAVLLIAVRTYRLIFHPELMKKPDELARPIE
jgi:TRAP-type transport system small permease protein